jgi:cytochrome c peroxidase
MPIRPMPPLVFALLLPGCFGDAPAAEDVDSSSAAVDESTSTATAADVSSESSGPEASSSTSGEAEGYPAEVTDVLDLPWPPYDYDPELPAHFNTPAVRDLDATPANNPITDDGATLGRVLFHDTALSANGTTACASCHLQSDGFADPVTLSEGFEGGLTDRNAMSAADARWVANGRFFWDERAQTLEEQVLMPIQNEVEMGMTLAQVIERVESEPYYPVLFERAFGDPEVTTERIAFALAQYVRATSSYRSRYDDALANAGSILDDFPEFTAQENLGKQIFLGPAGACAPCHLGNLGPPPMPGVAPGNQAVFLLVAPANNGLDVDTTMDPGVMTTTGDPLDDGKFKSTSLRNIARTGPYMHDGRFATLEEVVDHYDNGVQPHPNLDPRLRDPQGMPRRLNLDDNAKAALVAFLETLTDDALGEDPRFADPFRD